MLSVLQNVENAVEPFYTFGVNAIEHGKNVVRFLGDSYIIVNDFITAYIPTPFIAFVGCAIALGVSCKFIHWGC